MSDSIPVDPPHIKVRLWPVILRAITEGLEDGMWAATRKRTKHVDGPVVVDLVKLFDWNAETDPKQVPKRLELIHDIAQGVQERLGRLLHIPGEDTDA